MKATRIPAVRLGTALFAGLLVACGAWVVLSGQAPASTAPAQAHPPAQEKDWALAASDGEDLITADRNVRIERDVQGDVAAAGAQVAIEAPVNGYVMSAGRNIRVNGRIGDDLWAAGETVDVTGEIANNAMMAGRMVHLHRGGSVGNDARVAGRSVIIEGRVERDLDIGAGTARIAGDIGGSVKARAGSVTLLPGAVVRGDLLVRSEKPPDISPQAQVLGEVRYDRVEQGGRMWSWPLTWLGCFAALLVLGIASILLAPAWPGRVADVMRARAGASLLIGLALLVAVPIAALILAVTVIGIPLAVVMGALYVVVILLASVFVSYRVGEWLLQRLNRPHASRWARMALGALVVSLGITLPIVGWVILLAVLIEGVGALVLERGQQREALA